MTPTCMYSADNLAFEPTVQENEEQQGSVLKEVSTVPVFSRQPVSTVYPPASTIHRNHIPNNISRIPGNFLSDEGEYKVSINEACIQMILWSIGYFESF